MSSGKTGLLGRGTVTGMKITTVRTGRWLLAVDPGIRGCGVALFNRDGLLVCATYVRNPCRSGNRAYEAAQMALAIVEWLTEYAGDLTAPGNGGLELAVEWMRVYASRIAAGDADAIEKDPNDLLPLTGIDTALAALLKCPTTSYVVSEWKGQMKKAPCHARAIGRLDMTEKIRLSDADCPPSLMHNVLDALSIGLAHLKRLDKKRVIPG